MSGSNNGKGDGSPGRMLDVEFFGPLVDFLDVLDGLLPIAEGRGCPCQANWRGRRDCTGGRESGHPFDLYRSERPSFSAQQCPQQAQLCIRMLEVLLRKGGGHCPHRHAFVLARRNSCNWEVMEPCECTLIGVFRLGLDEPGDILLSGACYEI